MSLLDRLEVPEARSYASTRATRRPPEAPPPPAPPPGMPPPITSTSNSVPASRPRSASRSRASSRPLVVMSRTFFGYRPHQGWRLSVPSISYVHRKRMYIVNLPAGVARRGRPDAGRRCPRRLSQPAAVNDGNRGGTRRMRLMRIGEAGSERPVVRVDDDHYVDVSDQFGDFDEEFFGSA